MRDAFELFTTEDEARAEALIHARNFHQLL